MSSIWQFISQHPDLVITAVSTLLGLFGAQRWRAAVRAATAAEVDRWANAAAAAVVVMIRAGVFRRDEDAAAEWLQRFRILAAAAGVQLTDADERRASAVAHEAIAAAGQEQIMLEAAKIDAALRKLAADMHRLPKDPNGPPVPAPTRPDVPR